MKIKDRIKELKRVPASELNANPKNWRSHPDNQAKAMQGILAEVGWADAVLARETENGLELIDGHLRKEVAPDEIIPVLVLDVNEEEANKILATHDPIAAMAETNAKQVESLLAEVKTDSEDLQKMLDALKQPETIDAFVDEVPVPSLPEASITQPGDLWMLGDHRLLCGNCRNASDMARLMQSDKINIAITSPPYASQRKYDEATEFEPVPPDEYVDWFEAVQEQIAKYLATDGSWFLNIKEHCEEGQRSLYVKDITIAHVRKWGWKFVDEYCWTHGGTPKIALTRFKNGWEPVFQFTKGKHKFFPDEVMKPSTNVPDWNGLHPNMESLQGTGSLDEAVQSKNKQPKKIYKGANVSKHQGFKTAVPERLSELQFAYPSNHLSLGKNREALGHSAAYPEKLPAFFIQAYSEKHDIIFDPFCGSGTTVIAADKLDRVCVATEISPKYCDIIVKRWEAHTGRTAERVK